MSKRWIEDSTRESYVLYFKPKYSEMKIAEVYNVGKGVWCFNSDLLDVDEEYLIGDTLDDVKEEVESLVEDYFKENIKHYQYLLNQFKNPHVHLFKEGNVVGIVKGYESVQGILVRLNDTGDNWMWRKLKKKDSKPFKLATELPKVKEDEKLILFAETYGEYRRKYGIWT